MRAKRPRSATRRAHYPRDQAATSFTVILEDLTSRVPGAYAVALVDGDGETVDYAGSVDPFDARISAAHLRIVFGQIAKGRELGRPRYLIVRGTRRSFITYALPEGYALVMLLKGRARFTALSRAFFATERALCAEAGWQPSAQALRWHLVKVRCDGQDRPMRLRGSLAPRVPVHLEVLGVVVAAGSGLNEKESGFRVRTETGVELTLVREVGGRWYADEPIDGAEREPPRKSHLATQAPERRRARNP